MTHRLAVHFAQNIYCLINCNLFIFFLKINIFKQLLDLNLIDWISIDAISIGILRPIATCNHEQLLEMKFHQNSSFSVWNLFLVPHVGIFHHSRAAPSRRASTRARIKQSLNKHYVRFNNNFFFFLCNRQHIYIKHPKFSRCIFSIVEGENVFWLFLLIFWVHIFQGEKSFLILLQCIAS